MSDTLRSVGRDMRSKDIDEEDVEEHVSRFTLVHGESLISCR